MPDYVSYNTIRYRALQTGPRGTHHMGFRVANGTTNAAALAAIEPVLEAFIPFMIQGSSWSGLERAESGSEVFLPVAFTAINAVPGDRIPNNNTLYGAYVNFVGRTSEGSRVAFYLFNVDMAFLTANARLTTAESANVQPVIDVFLANNTVFVGIDVFPFEMRSYANTGVNDRVAKKARALV